MSDGGLRDSIQNIAAQAVLRGAKLLPYATRVRTVGWIVSHLVAPAAGWRKRIRKNLSLAWPDLAPDEAERIVATVPDAVGRTLIEIYSGAEFVERVKDTPLTGPGVATMEAARAEGAPLMLVTGHIGNYDVLRAMLYAKGYPLGALYKPMSNRAFNDHYLKAIGEIGQPLFPTDRDGIVALIRHLKAGKVVGIVADVASRKAPKLRFFDQPCHTPLSAAEWSVKYKARMIPVFGLRRPDGLTFDILVENEIPPGPPDEMMQAYNDVLERVVRAHPEQWFWIHRRWKTGGK